MGPKMGVKVDPGPWMPLLVDVRLTTLPHDLVVEGLLRDGLTPDAPEVRDALAAAPVRADFETDAHGTHVVLVFITAEEPPRRLWLHFGLLLLTIVTTLGSGALMRDVDPFRTRVLEIWGLVLPYPSSVTPRRLWVGASFAFPFLGVLICHEMGHFFAARRHGVRATLPYFIPFPPYLSVIGSLGAFIRLRGPTVRRASLFDIGAAGPIASFLLSVPLLAAGLRMSRTVPGSSDVLAPFVIRFAGQSVWLGNGIMTHALAVLFGPGGVGGAPIVLHPMALAGWLGLFVTGLNLLPLGQLDGGHVLYALFPERHRKIARLFLLTLLPLGLLWWGWWGWAVLVLLLHRGRVGHPRVLHPGPGLGASRVVLGWLLITAFVLTFVPVPIQL
jgi:membrane-associated protease RseP (regulator of RpoE activity)